MKDLSKNKFTKVFTAFLGVAAALTLLAAFISCEQANKASVVKQTDNNKDTGTELTYTLSAHTNYKVKTLTINGTTYSDITGNSITKKVKIEQETEVSAVVEADTGAPVTKYKVTVMQPENGKIEVTPALPAGEMVDTDTELTFTLSAHTGYNVKTLTINGTAYSDISGNSITKKVKIEQETEVSATVEADTGVTQIGSFTDTQG